MKEIKSLNDERMKLLDEVKLRLNYIINNITGVKGISVSTDEGLAIISTGSMEKKDIMAPISATYLHLSDMISKMLNDDAVLVIAYYKEWKVMFFQIGNIIFTVVMTLNESVSEVKDLLQKLFLEKTELEFNA